MNGYVCFYKGKRIEVRANTLFEAREEAAMLLNVPAKKAYMISVILAKKNGEQVTHTPVD